ncbi:3-isopropylmalate dehydratase large subunit [Bosea sp. (in: a-proteobacteria)]|jgi:3-isopropylmalate/(R)-2-methylmalate dehydratase large subunit|uniref:3-isopropylmalate dehydratase large subunit n=1 Tax=Bosea sp. (in: a-proteobacteria) TaxID=1871050 RepID=UPI0039C885A0
MGAGVVSGTMFEKIWDRHKVHERPDGQTLLYVDRHYVGDDLPLEAFETLRRKGLKVRRPELTFAMPDHYVSTRGRSLADTVDAERRELIEELVRFTAENGISLFPLDDIRQGIVHVVGPEQGLSQPGMTIVCGDSHTSTHGALGALGFGIGAAEVSHVFATQTLWQRRPRTMRVTVSGIPGPSVVAKDVIMGIIAQIGVAGAVGHVIEYAGETIRELSMEGRMTLCNMSIEAGARAGMVAPDEVTFAYLAGRPFAPKGAEWDEAVVRWRALASEADAAFDREVRLDAATLAPMVSWGTSPEDAGPITGRVPDPRGIADPLKRSRIEKGLAYMGLQPGAALEGLAVDRVFIGSCTNGRIEDLRLAAAVLEGRRATVPTLVVPGSGTVRAQAEAEGLDRIFLAAGCDWRHAGCSMCLAINGDMLAEGERCASTTNRNFVGRQGRGSRTHLMSPAMAAAAAVAGRLTDVRQLGMA